MQYTGEYAAIWLFSSHMYTHVFVRQLHQNLLRLFGMSASFLFVFLPIKAHIHQSSSYHLFSACQSIYCVWHTFTYYALYDMANTSYWTTLLSLANSFWAVHAFFCSKKHGTVRFNAKKLTWHFKHIFLIYCKPKLIESPFFSVCQETEAIPSRLTLSLLRQSHLSNFRMFCKNAIHTATTHNRHENLAFVGLFPSPNREFFGPMYIFRVIETFFLIERFFVA